jgi:hypothetical protein
MVAFKIDKPGFNDMLTDLVVSPKLSTHSRILVPVKGADNGDVKVLRKKRETIVDLRRVGQEVNNVSLVLILDTANLAYFDEAMNTGDKHLFNWVRGSNPGGIGPGSISLAALHKKGISSSKSLSAFWQLPHIRSLSRPMWNHLSSQRAQILRRS